MTTIGARFDEESPFTVAELKVYDGNVCVDIITVQRHDVILTGTAASSISFFTVHETRDDSVRTFADSGDGKAGRSAMNAALNTAGWGLLDDYEDRQ